MTTLAAFSFRRLALHLILIAMSLVMIYPILWMIFSSLKETADIFNGSSLLPKTWHFENYKNGWYGIPRMSFGNFFRNSAIICLSVIIGNIVSTSLVAYAFARLKYRLQSFWFAIMMITLMLPSQVTLIPQYILFNKLGWVNTYLPLIVPHFLGTAAFFVFLLVQFIRGIPRELDEAAIVDGCNPFQIYWRIILPLCVPALITVAIFSFMWTWDDFFSQLIYINDVHKYTVPLSLRIFMDGSGQSDWGPMLAMSVLSLVPSFIVFITCQRYFVQGIATTGIKG
jgi:multiple sugar transport system permease protein